MAEYRLQELASLSGVSARNIRAYRGRGLLDPPRREGRSVFYDDHHLSQLRTINELLRKGFTSAHIAEFFATTRQGHNLADILGLQQAIFGRHRSTNTVALDIDPESEEALRLVAHGLAEVVGDKLTLVDPGITEIVTQVSDQLGYVRTILGIADGIGAALGSVATAVVSAWDDSVTARFGTNYVPRPEDMAELQRMITDYRALGSRIVAEKFAAALQRSLVAAVADYTTDIVLAGHWDPNHP